VRRWLGLIASALLICCASQANACRSPDDERFVFLPAIPGVLPDKAVVLLVAPFNDEPAQRDRIRVRIERVVKGELTASSIEIRVLEMTGCDHSEFLIKPSYVVGTVGKSGIFNPLLFRVRDLDGIDIGQNGSFKIQQRPQ
jgi:hypothetical protein